MANDVTLIKVVLLGHDGHTGLVQQVDKMQQTLDDHRSHWSRLIGFVAAFTFLGGTLGALVTSLL